MSGTLCYALLTAVFLGDPFHFWMGDPDHQLQRLEHDPLLVRNNDRPLGELLVDLGIKLKRHPYERAIMPLVLFSPSPMQPRSHSPIVPGFGRKWHLTADKVWVGQFLETIAKDEVDPSEGSWHGTKAKMNGMPPDQWLDE